MRPRTSSLRFEITAVPLQHLLAVSFLGALGVCVSACANLASDCRENFECPCAGESRCGGGGSSSSNGTSTSTEGGSGGDGGSCDPRGAKLSSNCGVFVSSSKGSDHASGSMSSPVKTLQHALSLPNARRIYVCGESFDETIEISRGVTIYGSLDCRNGWRFDAASPSEIAPSKAGTVVSIASVSDAVDLEDLNVTAASVSTPGQSSIAVFVQASSAVSFKQVKLTAGNAAAGVEGKVSEYSYPTADKIAGKSAMTTEGGDTCTYTCPGSAVPTTGGLGGDATAGGQDGGVGTPNLGGGAAGLHGKPCAGMGTGGEGNPGSSRPAANGAKALGVLDATGWHPTDGKDGADGAPGQGGGGGASIVTAGGGGGGCGACGGAGAKHGGGGGASVALLVLGSNVDLTDSALIAKDAGDGGVGVAGQAGQTVGGTGGLQAVGACPGGNGGVGGEGGASGGGAGGVSAGILYKGKKPTLTKTSAHSGSAGKKGVGGGSGTNDGVAGKSGDAIEAP